LRLSDPTCPGFQFVCELFQLLSHRIVNKKTGMLAGAGGPGQQIGNRFWGVVTHVGSVAWHAMVSIAMKEKGPGNFGECWEQLNMKPQQASHRDADYSYPPTRTLPNPALTWIKTNAQSSIPTTQF
jgi:hypothetical protein